MRLPYVLPLLFAALLTLGGCGTILHGGTENITLNSDPPGAAVYENGVLLGRTPTIVNLSRSTAHTLTFQLEGYDDQSVMINRKVDMLAVAGNVLLTGLVGLVVDLATGGLYDLDPNQTLVMMRRTGASLTPSQTEDGVAVVFFTREQVEATLGADALAGTEAR